MSLFELNWRELKLILSFDWVVGAVKGKGVTRNLGFLLENLFQIRSLQLHGSNGNWVSM